MPKLQTSEVGFSLVEVLVSLMIISLFIGLSMQAFLIAVILKARAEQQDEAANWIQEDLEFIKHQAREYEKNAYPYSAKCSATDVANGVAASLLNDSVGGIGGNPKTDGPRILGGVPFVLTRNADYANSFDPFNLLKITYQVTAQTGGKTIATLSTEIVPDAALKCP
ncbi:prepilin-type cleavage/methylation domain-containing protein [Merismopedia glauca CCAP 1448/3]|uniref:Prepilin-type cleavage/methylation domain-containing protein n=1 Tax=Merismopedia glauca CCAP 1448/3 TaxID=1296344 RepID=A0A2T1C3T6_9CYAN|nr:prepilin-type cleavage/methylation domain-containing protein [Merismopedia glauca CCAP 1448/3]